MEHLHFAQNAFLTKKNIMLAIVYFFFYKKDGLCLFVLIGPDSFMHILIFLNHIIAYMQRMPKEIQDYCQRELPGIVDLKGPTGNIWPVGLKKTTDELLLRSGWKEFVEANHVQEGDLLVFKYDGNSCFDISIFDEKRCKRTACSLIDISFIKPERTEQSMEVLNVKSHRKGFSYTSPQSPESDILCARQFSTTQISKENNKSALNFQGPEPSFKRRSTRCNTFSFFPKYERKHRKLV